MPSSVSELAGDTPNDDNKDTFYCLLEDDKLVTQFSVITDRLLTPKEDSASENDVHLILHVTTIPLTAPTV